MNDRNALFISHASPEDNEFTIWLAAKLASAGYEVWADVLRLNGGDDWQKKLEDGLRNRACKVLLVANANSVTKQGVRNELQIASDVGRKINDPNFIIPLRLGPYEAPFLIAHAQYVEFSRGWAQGTSELLALLETEYNVPRHTQAATTSPWIALRSLHGRHLVEKPERLISNWLRIRRLPETLFYYGATNLRSAAVVLTQPAVEFREGWLTCEEHTVSGVVSSCISDGLEAGWPQLGIAVDEYRRMFSDLMNQSIGLFLESKALRAYEMASKRNVWWLGGDLVTGRVAYAWKSDTGSRKLQGESKKRKVHWHFGVSAYYKGAPIRHIRLKSHLIFTEGGIKPVSSKPRMHRLRRSFAKSWRNARWRDLLLAFLFWLSGGENVVCVPVSSNQDFLVEFPVITYTSAIGIAEDSVAEPEEDDPDVEFADEEDFEDEEE